MSKVAVITGGTKGIGRALVNAFADAGLSIVTCSRSKNDLDALQEEISISYDVNIDVHVVDMSEKQEVLDFGKRISKKYNSISALINNAGVFIPGQLQSEEDGVLEKMINTNLYSAYHLTRSLMPLLKKEKSSHIFNICSTASFVAYVNGGSYCISKFALLGFSKVLREELKNDDIRVTSVMPGATFSASWEGVDMPEQRFMPAEDVASTILSAYQMSDRTVIEELIMRPQLGDL